MATRTLVSHLPATRREALAGDKVRGQKSILPAESFFRVGVTTLHSRTQAKSGANGRGPRVPEGSPQWQPGRVKPFFSLGTCHPQCCS